MRVEGAELTAYILTEDGQNRNISLDLSATELKVIFKALGIQFNGDGTYTEYGPNTLSKILKGELNPFRLKEAK